MRKFTTPTLNITIKNNQGEVVTGLVFEYLIFTLKTPDKRLDKRVEYADYQEGTFKIRFTQEETGAFSGMSARAEINFFNGDIRLGTIIKTINLEENLIDEVI